MHALYIQYNEQGKKKKKKKKKDGQGEEISWWIRWGKVGSEGEGLENKVEVWFILKYIIIY